MNMKICHVCSGHTADDSRVFHKQCVSLVRAGYEVHLIATGTPGQRVNSNGVIVHPLPAFQNRYERFKRRWKVASYASKIAADLYHVHEPDLLGPVLARTGGSPVIFDVHESYLDTLMERPWLPKHLRPLIRILWDQAERRLVKRCAAIVAATDHIAVRYSNLHSKVNVIRNFSEPCTEGNNGAQSRDGRTCVFAGVLKADRNLGTSVQALGVLRRRGLAARLWLAGNWSPRSHKDGIFAIAQREGVSGQVHDLGFMSHTDAMSLQSRASIGLINILPISNSVNSLPIKMFECMTLGLPLIYSNFPSFGKLIGKAEVGIPVDPTSIKQTADAIEFLIRNPNIATAMGNAGKKLVHERFNWNSESEKLVHLYRDILTHNRSPVTTKETIPIWRSNSFRDARRENPSKDKAAKVS